MIKNSKKWVLFLLLLGFFGYGCGGSSQDRQANTDDAVQDFALLAQSLVGFFKNSLNSCESFNSVLVGLSQDPQKCDNGDDGSFTLIHGNVECTNGSPLNLSSDFTMNQTNCEDKDNNVISDGPLDFNFSTSNQGNIVLMSSTGIVVNGFNITTSNFEVKLRFTNNTLNCSGNLTVDGDECQVNSNCDNCKF